MKLKNSHWIQIWILEQKVLKYFLWKIIARRCCANESIFQGMCVWLCMNECAFKHTQHSTHSINAITWPRLSRPTTDTYPYIAELDGPRKAWKWRRELFDKLPDDWSCPRGSYFVRKGCWDAGIDLLIFSLSHNCYKKKILSILFFIILFTFSSYEKVFVLCEKSLSELSPYLHVLRPPESEKTILITLFD